MRRREVLIAIGAAVLFSPTALSAQPVSSVPRIGYIALPSSNPNTRLAAFRQRMQELGYLEGKTFLIEYRSAEGDYKRYPVIAAELARLKVNVILADDGTQSALAARNATREIPIVFPAVNDPVGSGLVASLARPGGNATGLTLQSPQTTAKRLQVLKEIVPGTKRVAVLVNPDNPSTGIWLQQLPNAAQALRIELVVSEVRNARDIDWLFDDIARKQTDGMLVLDEALFFAEASRIGALAAKYRIATLSGNSAMAEAGGLASYGPNRLDLVRRAANMVDKILKGAKPAELPVEQASLFELVINLNAAKVIGITVPPAVLLRADKVIE